MILQGWRVARSSCDRCGSQQCAKLAPKASTSAIAAGNSGTRSLNTEDKPARVCGAHCGARAYGKPQTLMCSFIVMLYRGSNNRII